MGNDDAAEPRTLTTPPREHHDVYCPKLYPDQVFLDEETRDQWVLGASKLLCRCEQLEAVRMLPGGDDALRLAYARGVLDAAHTDPAPRDLSA